MTVNIAVEFFANIRYLTNEDGTRRNYDVNYHTNRFGFRIGMLGLVLPLNSAWTNIRVLYSNYTLDMVN